MTIHISNLNLNIIEADLQRLFTPYGEIRSIEVVRDKLNNRSKGKAIIQMPVKKEGEKAVISLNGFLFAGRLMVVAGSPEDHDTQRGWQL
jgi:RNA recognition motif-containing protein